MGNRRVRYLVSGDELRADPPERGPVLAYVVEYGRTGFVVVSGDDRIDPVLTFNIEGRFRFDDPERNFMRHYLQKALIGRWDHLRAQVRTGKKVPMHTGWMRLRKRLGGNPDFQKATFQGSGGGRGTYVVWDTALWGQGDPYNDTVTAHNGNIQGIPTGCTATAMAIKMRFHEWPPYGNGSHGYSDSNGSVQYSHYVDFSAQTYDWTAMPTGTLDPNSAYPEVSDLMYHCGVAVEMDYEVGGSGAWPSAAATNVYFLYKGTIEMWLAHDLPAMQSIVGGLPVVMSSAPHTVVACGYRDSPSPYFYLNCGWNGGSNDWYNLDNIPGGGGCPIEMSYPFSAPLLYIYVDFASSGPESGLLQEPYNTVGEGNAAVLSGGELWIRSGLYTGTGNVPITFKKAMEIKPYGGGAVMIK
jgi:hypothetical protein